MPAEENKAIVARFIEEVLNRGNLATVDELLAPDFVLHHPASPEGIRGPESQKELITRFRGAFPDFHVTVEDNFGGGDRVAVRFTSRGTHRGELMGIPPTGRQPAWTGIEIYRVTGGKIVARWVNVDLLGLVRQLGATVTPPGQGGA